MQQDIEQVMWRRVEKYCKYLYLVPFVKMVAVCNNLSFAKVDEDSDIDLFIISKTGRLFFVRSFVTVLFSILGIRRHKNKVARRFCLSFFIDESAQNLSNISISNDYYLAFWIPHLIPVIDHENAFNKFMLKNDWVKTLWEEDLIHCNYVLPSNKNFSLIHRSLDWILKGFIGDLLEKILSYWQISRAKKKSQHASAQASLVINEHMLKFHNIDRRAFYRDSFKKKYRNELLSREKFLTLDL